MGLGHEVVLHGRNRERAEQALRAVQGARSALVGDLAGIEEMRDLARQANEAGPFDAVIHNAGVYRPGSASSQTVDGLDATFAINALAPYVLTALIEKPRRLIYLSSGLHQGGDPNVRDLRSRMRRWNGAQAYANSKLFDVALAFAVARLWPDALSNAVDPGWMPTRMGGRSASGDLEDGVATQVWLAVSEEPGAKVSGRYFYLKRARAAHRAASDVEFQDGFLAACEQLTGVRI